MSRTDKDTPWSVLSQRKENTVEYHDHTRSHIGAVACPINSQNPMARGKKNSLKIVRDKHQKQYSQHRDSGRCKKAMLVTKMCKHDIFGCTLDHSYCPMTFMLSMKMENRNGFNRLDLLRDKDITEEEIKSFIKDNGVSHEHTISVMEYNMYEPCKCDAWLIFTPCEHELNLDTMPHGITGAGRSRKFHEGIDRHREQRHTVRDDLRNAKYIDWREKLDPVE